MTARAAEQMPLSDRLVDNYQVNSLAPDERDYAIALMKSTLGDDAAAAKTEAYWTWKHERSVFGPSYVTGARAQDGTLASLRVMMRWMFSSPGGAKLLGVRPVDTATHVDHQRRGLFKRLTLAAVDDLAKQGAAFVFNTPNENSRPGYLKMGWSIVANWPLYVRPAGPLALLRRGGMGIALVENWSDFASRNSEGIQLIIDSNELVRKQIGWRTVRSPDYLTWRYGKVPSLEYEVVSVVQEGELAGFVIGRRTRGFGGLPAFVVTEIMSSAPSVGVYAALMRRTARSVRAAYLVAHFAEGTMEREALRRSGFVRMPRRGYVFTARVLNNGPVTPNPLNADAWDLTIGELEIF